MQFTHILGIDISKDTIDLALSQNKANTNIVNSKFSNNLKGYKALLKWFKNQGVKTEQLLICLENTGIYHRPLTAFLLSEQAFVWVENALEIKWSIGLQRGKNDQIDAQRICLYAFRNQDKAQAYSPKDNSLQNLADLLATRERLVEVRKMLLVPIKELKQVGLEAESKNVEKSCKKTLSGIDKDIEAIEKGLENIIAQHKEIDDNYRSVCSVPNVGKITALY
ncbi:transposase, partial [Rhizobium leguminosarum]|nr:transposase [Rhizobium leguminosarum]